MLFFFLRDFLPQSVDPVNLLWRTDSSTSMVYIQKEGGTVSRPLLRLSRRILLLALKRQVRILPVFLSSEENFLADAASRFQELPDWSLPEEAFRLIVQRWGLPEINLFASPASTQVPRFFAWGDAPDAKALNALAQPWEVSDRLRFPPPQVLRVIRKIEASSGFFLLITPFWPAQNGFRPSWAFRFTKCVDFRSHFRSST